MSALRPIALDPSDSEDPRAAIGARPVPGPAPAGGNIRYEPDFTALQDKIGLMESGGPLAVNWREVAVEGLAILETRSKDLLVGAYVTLALARTEGYGGLATGLAVIAGMLDAFWPDLQPPAKRERARVQALEWVVEQVLPVLTEKPPAEAEDAAVLAGYAAIGRIEALLAEKLTKESAALGDLIRLLREHARSAERRSAAREAAAAAPLPPPPPEPVKLEAVKPAPPPPPAAAPSPAAAPVVGDVAPPADAAAIDQALSRLQGVMLEVARGIRAADKQDPRGYALMRQAAWCTVRRAPPEQRGATLLPAPPPDRLIQIRSLQQAGNHAAAIDAIEPNIAVSPFWLDAHRLVSTSLQALGPGYEPARLAVTASLGGLLRRLPELAEFAFSNGTPFADAETRGWIGTEILAGGDAAGGGSAEAPWLEAERDARKLARSGQVKDGLALLGAGMAAARGLRERFAWQTCQAALCLEFGLIAPALALLDHLDAQVERYAVEDWEPALALQVSTLMHQCLLHADARALRRDEIRLPQLEAHRARLCRLDMAAALAALKI